MYRIAICATGLLAPIVLLIGDQPKISSSRALAKKAVDFGSCKVMFIRIAPPRLPVVQAAPVAETASPSAEHLAADTARAAKAYEQLSASVTVYPGSGERPSVSDLTWCHEDKRH